MGLILISPGYELLAPHYVTRDNYTRTVTLAIADNVSSSGKRFASLISNNSVFYI